MLYPPDLNLLRPLRPLRVQLSQRESQGRNGQVLASPFGRGVTEGDGEGGQTKRLPSLKGRKALERREPVNFLQGGPWYHSLCCDAATHTIGSLGGRIAARVTVGSRRSLLSASAPPLGGQ